MSNNNFFIKKNSTLPELRYSISKNTLDKYGISDDWFENAAVTFSMIDVETGLFKIANTAGSLIINNDVYSDDYIEKYTLVFKFNETQTSKTGIFLGEFIVDFLNNDGEYGKYTFPNNGYIVINITDSITKTSLI